MLEAQREGEPRRQRPRRAVCLRQIDRPGLYAAGVTGAALWRNVYTINVGGGCNANNINSGRVAANDAAEYLQA